MNTHHRIIIGDSRSMMEVDDESVHLVVTSPPYWQLKDYGEGAQIGFNDTYEDYVNNLNLVWSECYRVLHEGCRLCVNIGDQFARSIFYGRYKVIPIRTEIVRFCETIGFDYMGAIIWQKTTTCNTTGGATIMGSFPYPRNGILKIDYEFILIFRKQGKAPTVDKENKEESRLTTEEWNECFSGHWNFSGEKQDKHLAMFPEELPRRLVKMFTFVGDTVLDPFLGSGTTSLGAKNNSRNSIGYEINADFLPIIKQKLGADQETLFSEATSDVLRSATSRNCFKRQMNSLPYIFTDPVRIERKADPKEFRLGSRIEKGKNAPRETYYRVREIISADKLVLDNGLRIRLLGIKEKTDARKDAVDFLSQNTRAKRVFLKVDESRHDSDGNLLCYLYLQNKTFLNLHLLKRGLVEIDTSIEHRLKNRFLTAAAEEKCDRHSSRKA